MYIVALIIMISRVFCTISHLLTNRVQIKLRRKKLTDNQQTLLDSTIGILVVYWQC